MGGRWLVEMSSVLNPPNLEPFNFYYYHSYCNIILQTVDPPQKIIQKQMFMSFMKRMMIHKWNIVLCVYVYQTSKLFTDNYLFEPTREKLAAFAREGQSLLCISLGKPMLQVQGCHLVGDGETCPPSFLQWIQSMLFPPHILEHFSYMLDSFTVKRQKITVTIILISDHINYAVLDAFCPPHFHA